MRNLLVLTSHPVEDRVIEVLQHADWRIHYAFTPSQAQRLFAQEDPLVGLLIVWPEDPEYSTTQLTGMVSRCQGLKWVGVLPRGLTEDEAFVAAAPEHFFDFVSLPLDPERLAPILGRAYGIAEAETRLRERQDSIGEGRFGMIGRSPAMQALYHEIEKVSGCDVPVVIKGETGSGKDTVARAIHAYSACAGGPFVAVNCAAIPPNVGNGKPYGGDGTAFIDALTRTTAQIAGAIRGTLFLDYIAELPLPAQANLLRLLETHRSAGLEEDDPAPTSVRIISAANVDLAALVGEHRFRPDLYYRLHVLSVTVPGLRERGEDIKPLALHFLDKFRRRYQTRAQGFSLAAMRAMIRYDWPGNLRELCNHIQHAALYCSGPLITPSDLGLDRFQAGRTAVTLQQAREAAERDAITAAITRNGNNMTRAAEELQVSRMTLYRLLQKHDLQSAG